VVLAVKPVSEQLKLPVPVPETACVLLIVGFSLVLQQTPRVVTVASPSAVTLPPAVAVVAAMLLTVVVVTVGRVATVVSVLPPPHADNRSIVSIGNNVFSDFISKSFVLIDF
jgi:hypothetical protein